MMSLKGTCFKCKTAVTVFDPALTCYDCENMFHGRCLTPQLDSKEMKAVVIKIKKWVCPPCKEIRGKEFEEDTRTTAESKEIKKKSEMIDQVRNLLIEIEKALDDMENKCDDLTEKAKKLQMENLNLRIRLLTHKNRGVVQLPPVVIKPIKRQKNKPMPRKSTFRAISIAAIEEIQAEKKKTKKRFWRRPQKAEKPQWKKGTLAHPDEMGHFFKDLRGYAFSHGLGCGERVVMWLQDSLSHSNRWFLLLVLLLVVIVYTLLGALFFSYIEGIYERKLVDSVFEQRLVFINKVVESGDSNTIKAELNKYYDMLAEKLGKNGKILVRGDDILNWSFANSVFFCGTTYTTIGYGDIVPVTVTGKIVTIFYALFGIPIFLTLLAVMGSTLSISIKFIFYLCLNLSRCCTHRTGSRKHAAPKFDANDDNFNIPVWVAITMEIFYLLIGAYIFSDGEKWTFFDSFYFVFISMLTIGFGDFVPSNMNYMMGAFAYIIIGLAVTSMVITVIRDKIVTSFENATDKLGATIEQYIEEQYLADPDLKYID